ncbi:vesicle transport protein USE1 [Scaptodrosophila lebanonensis]|uniref:Vesicle transport protein USE1 n=1 Tax=Drosophila lebanonensis TaxID=7225 RepID=A0A6J2UFU3_DROLE|nr:vesicle transport protein USE1 [Scaptodrosophila lebanonensis]
MATKLNVNIRTLLTNCEELAKSEDNFWRLQKFIKSLDTMIAELVAMEDPQSAAKIPSYTDRVAALKLATNYTDHTQNNASGGARNSNEAGENALKEIRQIQDTKQYNELRKDLLQDGDSLRRRRGPDNALGANSAATTTDNMNEAVKYYNSAQEKITEHMLSLTRNLKEQTETANRIIRRDTEVVSRSTGMADRNINSLGKEAEKLEQHSRKAYKCWLWLMIVFVIVVFIGMVLFMKIMKKKKT